MDNKMVQLGTLISQAKTIRCGTGEYPILSMTMHDGLIFQEDKFKKVVASKDTSDYKVVYRNQLVISFPIDEGVLATQRITDAGIVSPAYGIWDIDSNQVLPEYLEYALRCERAIDYYKSNLRGSTARRRSLPTPTLLEFTVPLPDIKKQEHILDILHKIKDIISNQKAELQALDNLIKARFVEMFVGRDYPKAKISDLVTGKVSSVKKDFAQDDTIKYIDISSIDNQRNIMTGYTEYILSKAPSRAQQHIVEGDILISTVRPNLKNVAMTTFNDDNLVASSGFCVLRASKCLPSYLMAIVCSDEFTEAMSRVVTGANYPAIKDSDVMSYIVSVPPMDKQREFEALTVQVNKSKFAMQQALEKAQLLLDSLMQQYFG